MTRRIEFQVKIVIDLEHDKLEPKLIHMWAQDVKLLYPGSSLFNIVDEIPARMAKVISVDFQSCKEIPIQEERK